MRFVVERNTMARALGHVTGIVERRHTIPILGNVLIEAEVGAALTIKATDMDMEAIETAPAMIEHGGQVTVPAHTLHDIVRKLPEGVDLNCSYRQEKERLTVSAGRASFELAVLPAGDFPDMGKTEFVTSFKIAATELKRLFEKPRFAISTEETRYYLGGIFLHTLEVEGENKLRAVSTDGHRLARVEMQTPEGAQNCPGVIVPRKAVGEVLKLLADKRGEVEVQLSEAKIRFSLGDVVLTSKLVDGTFPDYARVIPVANDKVLKVVASELVKAVDRVSTLSSDKIKTVKLNIAGGRLQVSLNNPEAGSASEEIEAEFSGSATGAAAPDPSGPFEIGFNARYLLDIAGQIDGERIVARFSDPASPTLFLDESDAEALYVLMPMRV